MMLSRSCKEQRVVFDFKEEKVPSALFYPECVESFGFWKEPLLQLCPAPYSPSAAIALSTLQELATSLKLLSFLSSIFIS